MRALFLVCLLGCSSTPMSPIDGGNDVMSLPDTMASDVSVASSWSKLGLDGNVIAILAIDPKSPSTIYAGATAGGTAPGFYRSKDNGKTWGYVPNLPHQSAHAIAIHPSQNIILATLGIQMFRSADGGETWNEVAMNIGGAYTLAFHPTQMTAWTVTSQDGVYRSSDGGMTFMKVTTTGLPPPNTHVLGPIVYDGAKLYLACDDTAGAYVSSDDGTTWTPASGLPSGAPKDAILTLAAQPGKTGVIFAETTASGLYRTENGSAFTKVDLGMEMSRFGGLAFDPMTTSTLYVGRDDNEVLKSTDTGKSWMKAGPAGHNALAIAVSPTDSGVFIGTSGDGVWRFGK